MASAEKLPDWLANAFEEKFGLRPMEGYGCTECSPVVTCSTHDFRATGFRQAGSRRGSIGQPLPAVSVRIVDPDTRRTRTAGQVRPAFGARSQRHARLPRPAGKDGGSFA